MTAPPAPTIFARLATSLETHRGARHLDALDGLRGIAVLLVFLCHFQVVILARLGSSFLRQPYFLLAEFGATGVDLFFLLSGYLVYQAFLRPGTLVWPFWMRRLRRVYPTFLVVLALYLLLTFALHLGGHFHPSSLAGWLSYVAANLLLLPGVFDLPNIVYPAWSLSFELLFYLAVPLFVLLLRLPAWRSKTRCILWVVSLAALMLCALVTPWLREPRQHQQATPLVVGFFLGGMLLADMIPFSRIPLVLTGSWRSRARITVLLSLAGFVAFAWPLFPGLPHGSALYAVLQNALLLLIFGVTLVLSVASPGTLSALCRCRALRWTGNVSYSLYLIHGLPLDAFALLIPRFTWFRVHPLLAAPLLLLLCAALTLALTLALFLGVERPLSLVPSLRHRPRKEGALETSCLDPLH